MAAHCASARILRGVQPLIAPWRCRHGGRASCQPRRCLPPPGNEAPVNPRPITTSLSSLDTLLGSMDDTVVAEHDSPAQRPQQTWRPLRVPDEAWAELREPRGPAVAAPALAAALLLVYSGFYATTLAAGPQFADDALARLANDHAAVASGDTLRLFTAAFVARSPEQLLLGLAALLSCAMELEALLGSGAFWALWTVAAVAGGAADAFIGGSPVTAGPAPGVAGAAAALLAHQASNWRLEQLVNSARRAAETGAPLPSPLPELEAAWNAAAAAAAAAASAPGDDDADGSIGSTAGVLAAAKAATAAVELSPSGELPPGLSPTRPRATAGVAAAAATAGAATGSPPDSTALVETALEAPLGLGSFSVMLPAEGAAFLALGGTTLAVLSALREAVDADGAPGWAALTASFFVGGLLGAAACPRYCLCLEVLPPAAQDGSSDGGRAGAAAAAAGGGGWRPQQLLLLPRLRDMRPPAARANALVGGGALLFASLGSWLLSQGTFV